MEGLEDKAKQIKVNESDDESTTFNIVEVEDDLKCPIKVLELFDLPVLTDSDSPTDLLEKYECIRRFLNENMVGNNLTDYSNLISKINEYKDIECYTDKKEIELAKFKGQYFNKDISELKRILNKHERLKGLRETYLKNKNIIEKVENKEIDSIYKYFTYLKPLLENYRKKQLLIDYLGPRKDIKSILLRKLVHSKVVTLEDISDESNKIQVLRLVYELENLKIVEFDRENGSVGLLYK